MRPVWCPFFPSWLSSLLSPPPEFSPFLKGCVCLPRAFKLPPQSTCLTVHLTVSCVAKAMLPSSFSAGLRLSLKQLSRLLLVRPVRRQEHVGTASSYAGITGGGMPRNVCMAPGVELRSAFPVTVPVGLSRCILARRGPGPGPWALPSPRPGLEPAQSASSDTALLPGSTRSFVFFNWMLFSCSLSTKTWLLTTNLGLDEWFTLWKVVWR